MDNAVLDNSADTGSDPVSNVLKWVLLITAIVCFAVVIWGTFKTYQLAPPLPQQFATSSGQIVMTQDDIVSGKAGFQRADLMDYGSLYGMGSYFGEDYTAKYLVRLGRLTEDEMRVPARFVRKCNTRINLLISYPLHNLHHNLFC